MPRRFLVTSLLAAALLYSQAGSVILSALCPHLQSQTASCEPQRQPSAASHEEMGHMDHNEMEPEPLSPPHTEAFAIGQSVDPCLHCAVHSRSLPSVASLRATDAAKRTVELSSPHHFSIVAPALTSPAANFTSRAHSPPGENVSRHILISIFRI